MGSAALSVPRAISGRPRAMRQGRAPARERRRPLERPSSPPHAQRREMARVRLRSLARPTGSARPGVERHPGAPAVGAHKALVRESTTSRYAPERGFFKADARTRTGDPFITSASLAGLFAVSTGSLARLGRVRRGHICRLRDISGDTSRPHVWMQAYRAGGSAATGPTTCVESSALGPALTRLAW